MSGTYYLQYYDNVFDYLLPLFKIAFKIPGYDCLSGKVSLPLDMYDINSLPLKKRVQSAYILYQDATENTLIGYMCFDSRSLNDLIAIGL